MRIVSLLPSATEIVCDLGLGAHLVGVSHECDFPPFVNKLPRVTSSVIPKHESSKNIDQRVRDYLAEHQALYLLDLELLDRLRPDLIITQALCDVCAVSVDDIELAVRTLHSAPCVINLEPSCLGDVFDTIRAVGEATGRAGLAAERIDELTARVHAVTKRSRSLARRRLLLLEWLDPPFNAGHWNPELIELAGAVDCLGEPGNPSRRLAWGEIRSAAPDLILIACCGFTIDRALQDIQLLTKNADWRSMSCVLNDQVYVLDGNAYFSRPGPRLVDGLELLAAILRRDGTEHSLPRSVLQIFSEARVPGLPGRPLGTLDKNARDSANGSTSRRS